MSEKTPQTDGDQPEGENTDEKLNDTADVIEKTDFKTIEDHTIPEDPNSLTDLKYDAIVAKRQGTDTTKGEPGSHRAYLTKLDNSITSQSIQR